ncbi:MAG: 50S ribosomal protein L29 [Phycisphaerales bacterium]
MAKKKTSEAVAEVHKMKDAEIVQEVDRLRKRLADLRTQAVTEKLENPSEFRTVRRTIARLLTEQSARRVKKDEEVAA